MKAKLSPPPGYTSWLDYAVDCMDTRSLEQQELWIDDPAQRHWPEGTTSEQMQQAVRDELAELRARAITDQLQAPSSLFENCETIPQAVIDEWCDRNPAPPLEGLVPPNEMADFRNRSAIEKANSCACYGCLATFDASEVTKWTDDGQTAICPRCGIDSVLAQTEPKITMEQLQALHQKAFRNTNNEGVGS